jgi:nitrite reductase/ring-hydroxylating ferredoxin subunit
MAAVRREFVVAEASEIPPGSRKIVQLAGRSIGIFNIDGEFFALTNTCPHAGAELCRGTRSGFVRSRSPGEYDYIRRGEVLRCPWHQWEFDIRTGRSWWDPAKVRVRSYETHLARGADLAQPAGEKDTELIDAGLRPGPYTVETFPVRATEEYVIVTL